MTMDTTRKLDPTSPHYLHCYTLDELAAYVYDQLSPEKRAAVFCHLNQEKCERCRELYRLAGEVGSVQEDGYLPGKTPVDSTRLAWLKQKKRKPVSSPPAPGKLEKGQVWISNGEVRGAGGRYIDTVEYAYPVMIVDPGSGTMTFDNPIRVVPFSVDTDFSWPGHSLLLSPSNPIDYPCLVEIFNERPMLAGNLKSYCGILSSEDLHNFSRERQKWLSGDVAEPEDEIKDWEARELQLADYLSVPVNEMVWGGEEMEEVFPDGNDEEVVSVREICQSVELADYALAAATDENADIPLSDVHVYPLYSDGDLDVILSQERDRVSLVVTLAGGEPKNFTVDHKAESLEKLLPDQYFFPFTPKSILAGRLEFSFVVEQRLHRFIIPLTVLSQPVELE